MLRHARIRKVHTDRGLEDVMSFKELQETAVQALHAPASGKAWFERLQGSLSSNGKYVTRSSPAAITCTTISDKTPLSSEIEKGTAKPQAVDVSPLAKTRRTQPPRLQRQTPPNRRPRRPAPQTLIRVDSVEMRDGDSRMVLVESSPGLRKRLMKDTPLSSPAKRVAKIAYTKPVCQAKKVPETTCELSLQDSGDRLPAALTVLFNNSCPRRKVASTNNKNQSRFSGINSDPMSSSPDHSHELGSSDYGLLPSELQNTSPFASYSVLLAPGLQVSLLRKRITNLCDAAQENDSLAHWKRDILPAAQPPGRVVPESQADPDLQKAILVEPDQTNDTRDMIDECMSIRLAPGERIEIWNWEILEELSKLEVAGIKVEWSTVQADLGQHLRGVIRPATTSKNKAIGDHGSLEAARADSESLRDVSRIRVTDDRIDPDVQEGALMPNLLEEQGSLTKEVAALALEPWIRAL